MMEMHSRLKCLVIEIHSFEKRREKKNTPNRSITALRYLNESNNWISEMRLGVRKLQFLRGISPPYVFFFVSFFIIQEVFWDTIWWRGKTFKAPSEIENSILRGETKTRIHKVLFKVWFTLCRQESS